MQQIKAYYSEVLIGQDKKIFRDLVDFKKNLIAAAHGLLHIQIRTRFWYEVLSILSSLYKKCKTIL